MLSRRFIPVLLLLTLVILSISNAVMANDDRLNLPPYHFGGDTLYCDETNGCTLLNMTGQFLWNWPHADIVAAFETLAQTGENALVGEGVGTYGPATLWVIPTDETNGNRSLCFQGIDEWGKQNDMCFEVTLDWLYKAAPLPAPAEAVADCSMWDVGDPVQLIGGDFTSFGFIGSIDAGSGTVVVNTKRGSYTAGCDEIKLALT